MGLHFVIGAIYIALSSTIGHGPFCFCNSIGLIAIHTLQYPLPLVPLTHKRRVESGGLAVAFSDRSALKRGRLLSHRGYDVDMGLQ